MRVAYQAFGEGPRTLIGIPGLAQNLDTIWDHPVANRFFERLASICRCIHFDKRGTGVSSRDLPPSGLEERVRDISAVMEAEHVDHAVLAGTSEGAALAMFFAATYPRSVDGLILSGACATLTRKDDHPWAPTLRYQMRLARLGAAVWGHGFVSSLFMAPSMSLKPRFWRWAGAYERASLHKRDLVPYVRINTEIDLRHILGSIQAPTLVLHAGKDRLIPSQSGRYLADRIAGSRYIELPTRDHVDLVRRPGPVPRRHLRLPAVADGGHPRSRSNALDGAVHRHRRFHRAGRPARRRASGCSSSSSTTSSRGARSHASRAAG